MPIVPSTEPAAAPNRAPRRCPCCGYRDPDGPRAEADRGAASAKCPRCEGTATSLTDDRQRLRTGRGSPPFDLWRGFVAFPVAAAQVLHHRAFVGRLKAPLAINAVTFLALAAVLVLFLLPLFSSWFAEPWPILDGWRRSMAGSGPVRLLLATAWLLGPIWLDVSASAAMEPLARTAERVIGGPGIPGNDAAPSGMRATLEQVHFRARLFATLILSLPLVWAVSLVPYVGLPLLFVAGAALAALLWCEPPALRRGLDRRQYVRDLRTNWARALGFGAGCQVGMAVPFVNVLLLAPAAAVGAAMLHFQFEKRPEPLDPRVPPQPPGSGAGG